MITKLRWGDLTEDESDYFINNYSFGEKSPYGHIIIREDKTNSIKYDSIDNSNMPLAIRMLYLYKDCILLGFKGIGDVL